MGSAYVKIPIFKKGDILEVIGDEKVELEVASQELTFRPHNYNPDFPDKAGYCYWYGTVYKRMKGSSGKGILVFLKLTLNSITMGVLKLEKEKSFCVDYPYIERVYGLYEVKAKNDTDRNPRVFKALLCEYIEGVSMYHYYTHGNFREKDYGIKKRDEEILLFRYFLQAMFAIKFYTEQCYTDNHAHRDLKPDNIIICTKEKRIVIIDFDFAHVPELNTMFMNPETDFTMPRNIECSSVQKDIHTIGWTLLFCLTGEVYKYSYKIDNNTFFSIDRNFMLEKAEKYLNKDYEMLINIIEKMIADPSSSNAYTSVDELIYDYKKFIRGYVLDRNELKEVMTGTELLLQSSDEPDKDSRYNVRVWFMPEKGSDLRSTLFNFETMYYAFDKTVRLNFQSAHLCIQNVNGDLYYMILDDKVKTDADKVTCVIKTGDSFWYNNQVVTIKVTKQGDIENGYT